MKIYLETMGCQMNRLDSELVLGSLRAAGHEIVCDAADADVVLYNTCSVRRHAEQKVLSRIGADAQRKSAGRRLIVGVLGCMAQRMGGELRQRYPQVDIVCAPGQIHRLGDLIEAAARGQSVEALDPQRGSDAEASGSAAMDRLDSSRDVTLGSASQAFVRVQRGCDRFCTYCIVPYVRGPQRSRDPRQVVEEVRRLVDAGRTEITLLGQTVNSYLWRDGGATATFAELLYRVSAVANLRRLRFVTSHPVCFGDDVLQAMRDLPNVCPYIHVPAQSGSDAVLERMHRGYTVGQYNDLVDRARAIVPDVVIAGDFIVGFSGETEADHQASAALIRRSGYKNSFVFKYSPRPGTAAAKRYKDDVPTDVKKRRNAELLAVQGEVGLAHHLAMLGRVVEVLVEGPSPKATKAQRCGGGLAQLVGRTRGDHIVCFEGPLSLAGQYVNVEISEASSLTLVGRVVF